MPSLLEDRVRNDERPAVVHEPKRRDRRIASLRAAAALAGVAVLVALVGQAGDLWPNWGNPVQQKVVDRSTPPLMLALDDLSEYHAATGTFQVVIDQERDTPYIPSVISGERTSFLATGTVDASVDFTGLGAESVQVSADRRSVTIALPAPRLGEVRVDPSKSRVLDHDRGVVQRVGSIFAENPSGEGKLYALAEKKVSRAAAASDLERRAQDNTRTMLTTLARSLGFTKVTVTFNSGT